LKWLTSAGPFSLADWFENYYTNVQVNNQIYLNNQNIFALVMLIGALSEELCLVIFF